MPPSKQTVWRVIRTAFFADKGIPQATLLASLRAKYGKETITNHELKERAANDSQIQTMVWLFDEQGRPAPLPPNGAATIMECPAAVELADVEQYANLFKGKYNHPALDWCYASYTAVYVSVLGTETPGLYGRMRAVAVSLPLALRTAEATSKWKKDIAEGQQKQDIEKAKQQEKPKL